MGLPKVNMYEFIRMNPNWYRALTVNQATVGSNPTMRANISRKCYGSTSVSKTEGVGSTPTRGAKFDENGRSPYKQLKWVVDPLSSSITERSYIG